jgi:hypothetical protein
MAGRTRWAVSTGFLAGLMALAGSAIAADASSVPSNLCTLSLKPQLAALKVGSTCKQAATAKVGPMTIEGANWGSVDNSIGIQVWQGVSAARFKQNFGSTGSPVKIGSFGREATGSSGAALSAWINGVGLVVNLNHPGDPNKNKVYFAPVLALGKAAAKQL